MGIVVNFISHIMKTLLLSQFENKINLKTIWVCAKTLRFIVCSPLFSPCVVELGFCSKDRKQVIQKIGHPPYSSDLSLFHPYFSL